VRAKAIVVVAVLALLSPAAGTLSAASDPYGIHVVAPPGWQVRVTRGTVVASTTRLPAEGRWISRRLGRSIGDGDLDVVLYEDAPSDGQPFSTSTYRRGPPRPFRERDFGRPPLGGSNPGAHRFARRNFTVAGRFFDLFVESGRRGVSPGHLRSLDRLVRSLRVRPGDFYPGIVRPATFAAAHGWNVMSSPPTPFAPETFVTAIASTVPYRDHLNEFPPHRTLAALPRDGVIVVVQLTASNRDPPIGRTSDRGQIQVKGCGSFEGVPSGVAVCPLSGLRNRQYSISGWVVYGAPRPTRAMKQRAAEELTRLALPAWPRWS
jgi:hypothetical protein